MKVIADVSIVPLGVGVSLSKYVAECEKIFAEAGLKTSLHAYGTNLEGEWEAVFTAIKKCHERLHEMGVPRISTNLRLGTRVDRPQSMEDKVRSVQEKLGSS
ncbi:MAG: MTH1187 family thiamine-binding protein [candidate division KSB1 bacterium]|nr:MTH1187 family thiamine-binding protein [candidate division KSB1 bacterium]